jgi:hypothetical protein
VRQRSRSRAVGRGPAHVFRQRRRHDHLPARDPHTPPPSPHPPPQITGPPGTVGRSGTPRRMQMPSAKLIGLGEQAARVGCGVRVRRGRLGTLARGTGGLKQRGTGREVGWERAGSANRGVVRGVAEAQARRVQRLPRRHPRAPRGAAPRQLRSHTHRATSPRAGSAPCAHASPPAARRCRARPHAAGDARAATRGGARARAAGRAPGGALHGPHPGGAGRQRTPAGTTPRPKASRAGPPRTQRAGPPQPPHPPGAPRCPSGAAARCRPPGCTCARAPPRVPRHGANRRDATACRGPGAPPARAAAPLTAGAEGAGRAGGA